MKKAVLKTFYKVGGFKPFQWRNSNKLLILTYHRFSERESSFSVSQDLLREQIEYIRKNYDVITFAELNEFYVSSTAWPKRAAIITIDDGFEDAYTLGFPVLRAAGVPATLFVVTDLVDGKSWMWTDKMRYLFYGLEKGVANVKAGDSSFALELGGLNSRYYAAQKVNDVLKKLPDEEKDRQIEKIAAQFAVKIPESPTREFASINWQQALELEQGGVSIESHTVTHPILPNTDIPKIRQELSRSKQRIEEKLNKTASVFCYPNGSVNEEVRSEVEAVGYKCAVTTRSGLNGSQTNRFLLNRVDAQVDVPGLAKAASGFEEFQAAIR
jgi:peptidoglycan/xylan/chitin deacetylase (PgdA/CDA1 family)